MSSILGFLVLLGVLFVIFKFTGIIAWSWLAVLAPFAIAVGFLSLVVSIAVLIVSGAVMQKEGIIDKIMNKGK